MQITSTYIDNRMFTTSIIITPVIKFCLELQLTNMYTQVIRPS